MRGLTPADDWTHLIPGLAVAGVGAGLINVPLASTAVSVVEPARAGMASGVNSTFRQVGIATGIAALGSIFASTLHDDVVSKLASSPIGERAESIADRAQHRPDQRHDRRRARPGTRDRPAGRRARASSTASTRSC